MPQPILLDLELEVIHNFLEHVFKSVDEEYISVIGRKERGEFETVDDWENAYFWAMSSEELAIRSSLIELSSLIEWEVQGVASRPSIAKTLLHRKRKFIWDMKWDQLCQVIEANYRVEVSQLDSYQEIMELRRVVNAFKHRKRFRDPRRDPIDEMIFPPDRYEISIDNMFGYVKFTRRFLLALWNATGTR